MRNLLDWDRIMDAIHKEDAVDEEADYQEYLEYMKKFGLDQLKWAASETTESNDIRRRIGRDFEEQCPITLKLYSAKLYVLNKDSALLTIMKGDKIASDLNGKRVDFFLADNIAVSYSDTIQDGDVIVSFMRLGVTIEEYKSVSFRLHLDDSTVIDGSLCHDKCRSD